MEKRIAQKIDEYNSAFISALHNKIAETLISEESKKELGEFIASYEKINIEKTDFLKRKRSQVVVPVTLRCISKRSDGDQCSRKKKDGCEFCGTHSKGSPYGTFSHDVGVKMSKIEVWAQDICGILYYVDNKMNVYQTEDIINNKANPKVIATYEKQGEKYSIPAFNI